MYSLCESGKSQICVTDNGFKQSWICVIIRYLAFGSDDHPNSIINIVTGRIALPSVNVDEYSKLAKDNWNNSIVNCPMDSTTQ